MEAFDDLFGTKTRRPRVCAVTGQRLQKSDALTRQRLAGTEYYVFCTRPLSEARLTELIEQAAKGPAKAAKPAKDKD